MAPATELLVCVMFSSVHVAWLAPPAFDPMPSSLVLVLETEGQEKLLMSGITCTDPDGDVTRAFLSSIHPTHPCEKCFHLWPCDTGSGYCLVFEPSLGRLLYDTAPAYMLHIMCVDDVDPEFASQTIDVQVVANSAPVFTTPGDSVEIRPAIDMHMGDVVYDVDVNDVDGDTIFYTLFTEPGSDLFEIGYVDGSVRVTQDLRQLCEDSVTFEVLAADSLHTPVGPANIKGILKKRNHRPVIQNSQTEFEVKEDKHFALNILADDADGDDLIFKMSASPSRGLEYYAMDRKGRITDRKALDYEYALLRTVDLYIDVTDGFCEAETFRVTIRITDVDEPPVIKPDYVEMVLYEGFLSVDPGWAVVDPDLEESHVWSAVNGGGNQLVIDASTGFIHSTGEIDIDPKSEEVFTFKVQVKDKDNLKDTAVVRLTVLDKNDHVPTFVKQLYEYSVSPCTKVGVSMGVIHARDKDSHFQGNHHLIYSGSGQNISVLATGDVILKTQCTPGQVETIEAFVTDQGTVPGPLAGVPTTVSVRCNPCPVPVTTEATTETTRPTTSYNSTTEAYRHEPKDYLAINLAWFMPALILAFSLVALLAYVISSYCCPACAKWRARRAMRKRFQKEKPKKQKREKLTKCVDCPKVLAVVEVKPTPPILPPVEIEPFLYGFWKETYADRDQRQMPRRDVIPASVEQDKVMEEYERKEREKEKGERRLQRQIIEDRYRSELEKYNQQIMVFCNKRKSQSF